MDDNINSNAVADREPSYQIKVADKEAAARAGYEGGRNSVNADANTVNAVVAEIKPASPRS